VPLRIIEYNKGGLCLVDSNLHIFTRINTKLTTGPITWSCVNKKNKHIKCGSSCVTEGLDRNTGYFKRQILQEHRSLYRFKDSIQDIIFLNNAIYDYVDNSLTKKYVDLVLLPELLICLFLPKLHSNFDENYFIKCYIDTDNYLNNDRLYKLVI
jgi:hypothetical protein